MNRLLSSMRPVARNAIRVNARSHVRFFSTPETFLARDDVVERVLSVVKTFDKVDPTKVTDKAHFADDLGLDSLDFVEVQMALRRNLLLKFLTKKQIQLYLADAIDFIASHPQAK